MGRRATKSVQHPEVLGRTITVQVALLDAMTLSLPCGAGLWKQIAQMSAEEYLDAIELLIVPFTDMMKAQVRKELYSLDYRQVIEGISFERWYMLDEVIRSGAHLPSPLPKREASALLCACGCGRLATPGPGGRMRMYYSDNCQRRASWLRKKRNSAGEVA